MDYPFDKYFDQQINELEKIAGTAVTDGSPAAVAEKKDPLVQADTGGPPPPSVPGLRPGEYCFLQAPYCMCMIDTNFWYSAAKSCALRGDLER